MSSSILTEAELKKKTSLEAEINKLDEELKNAKRGGAAEIREKLKEVRAKLERLKEGLEQKDEIIKRNEEKIKSWVSLKPSGSNPYVLHKVTFPGGKQLRISLCASSNNILKPICYYLSLLDSPFEKARGYTETEKKELLESILPSSSPKPAGFIGLDGSTWVPKDTNDSINKNKNISDWRIKKPGTENIVEPMVNSFEWFDRWWEYLANYAKNEYTYTSELELVKYPKFFTITDDYLDGNSPGVIQVSEIRNIHKLIKDNQENTDQTKRLAKAERLIFSSSRPKYPMFITHWGGEVEGLDNPPIIHTSVELVGDFIYYFNKLFNRNRLNDNYLLKDVAAPSGKVFKLTPDDYRTSKKYLFLVPHFELKSGANSMFYKDHEVRGVKGNYCDGACGYVPFDENNPPYVVEKITDGFRGPIELFHSVFFDPSSNMKDVFYTLSPRKSKPTGFDDNQDLTSQSAWLTERRFTGFKKGDLERVEDVDETKIQEAEDEIQDLEIKLKNQVGSDDLIRTRRRILQENIGKLKKQLAELIGKDEDSVFEQTLGLAQEINRTGKKYLEKYEEYRKSFGSLQDLVKARLIAEKKIEESDNWTFDSSPISNEDKDKVLSRKSILITARNETNTMLDTKVNKQVATLGAKFYIPYHRSNKKELDDFLKDWLVEKNKQDVDEVLRALEEISNEVKLDEQKEELLEKIKKSDLIPRNLEAVLRNIIDKAESSLNLKWSSDIIKKWNAYKYKKTKYNEGSNFHKLISLPSDIRTGDKFKNFLTAVSDKKADTLAELIDKTGKGEADVMWDVVSLIQLFRVQEYMEKTRDERNKDWEPKEIYDLIVEAEVNGQDVGSLNVKNKTGDELKKDLRKIIGQGLGKVLGLSPEINSELQIIMKWRNYTVEEAENLLNLLKQKDEEKKSYIKNNEPAKIHLEIVDEQIKESGITAENVAQIKQTDKEGTSKLEKLEVLLEKAEEKGVATAEHKKLLGAINAHKATWKKTDDTDDKDKGTTGDDKDKGTTGDDKDKGTTGDDKDKGTTGDDNKKAKTGDTPWYAKAGYAVFWAPVLIAAVAFGVWYFAFRKPEDTGSKEGEEAEEETVE